MNIPNRFIQLLNAKQIVPFVGAGFSMPSGAPSWSTLVQILIERLSGGSEQISALKAIQEHLHAIDMSEVLDGMNITPLAFYEAVRSIFNSSSLIPNEYHHALFQLDFDTIITTNWDFLLEKHLTAIGRAYTRIYDDQGVVLYNPSESMQLIKLHGDVESKENMVYKRSHYEVYWQKRRILESLFTILASTKSFLFIGYGMGDPNIQQALQLIKQRTGNLSREHYALVYGDNDSMKYFWESMGVQVIQASGLKNRNASTLEFLNELIIHSKQVSVSNLERAKLVNKELLSLISSGRILPVLRMRGSLGWLSNPTPEPNNYVYGSQEQDEEEHNMTNIIYKILDNNSKASVRQILHINSKPLLKKFSASDLVKRLQTLLYSIEKYPEQIHIVHTETPSYINNMIIDELVFFSGNKVMHIDGIKSISLLRDSSIVRKEIKHFEQEYNDLLKINMAAATSLGISAKSDNQNYIKKLIKDEILFLSNMFNYKGMDLLAKAVTFAIIEHSKMGQTREDNVTPYGEHLVRVIEKLQVIGKIRDYEVLAAAALHDIVEDTNWDDTQVEELFGTNVAKLVGNMTQRRNASEQEYLDQLEGSDDITKAIKLADRLDNVQDILKFNSYTFGNIPTSEYINNSLRVLEICRPGNSYLANELDEQISNCIKIIQKQII